MSDVIIAHQELYSKRHLIYNQSEVITQPEALKYVRICHA